MLVHIFTSSYAPCMVQLRIVNKRTLARVTAHVQANGGPDEDTALLSWDDLDGILRPSILRDLREWESVNVRMDDFEVLTMYGYDANTLTLPRRSHVGHVTREG
jgi:hypothetical protein